MRMVSINQKNSQPMDNAEHEFLELIQSCCFNVPEPIMFLLRQLGNVETVTKQNLIATFPTLPQQKIGGRGGYYGVLQPPGPGIDDTLHNLYEEIPCLGVLSEAIMHAMSNEKPGPYQSVVTYEGLQPNQNLIGFKPLGYRRPEAINLAGFNDIFKDYPANTAINFSFLTAISSILATTKTFRISKVKISEMSIVGSVSQIIISRPITNDQTCLGSGLRMTSLSKESSANFSNAVFLCSQLLKKSGPNADHTTWCMISSAAERPGLIIPPQWVVNRNQRRNLPIQFMQEVFVDEYSNDHYHRLDMVKKMVTPKR